MGADAVDWTLMSVFLKFVCLFIAKFGSKGKKMKRKGPLFTLSNRVLSFSYGDFSLSNMQFCKLSVFFSLEEFYH